MPWTCDCGCHQGSVLKIAPDVRDVTEAAVACSQCIDAHCLSITADWPWPYIPRPAPAPRPPTPLPAADGIPYDPSDPTHDTDHS